MAENPGDTPVGKWGGLFGSVSSFGPSDLIKDLRSSGAFFLFSIWCSAIGCRRHLIFMSYRPGLTKDAGVHQCTSDSSDNR
jgi:hypothetical protein